ncbi:hypothetical protein [Streptomyces sp. NPDC093225]|uniref:hypothetical protein n=1 Tax=Streptomyces sp. NPDC093225 TaxID=3366034 RepID=UPI00380FD0EB
MAPKREIDEGTAGGQLAAFLVALTKEASVRELAERFGSSRSSWGNYLNGSQLIPKQLVGRLVESFTPVGPTRQTKAVHALELWNAAATERRASRSPSGDRELVRHHQRRDDALRQVIKYQTLAANAEKHLAELRPMLAYTQSRLENAELQLQLGDERERARLERQLGQARERLGRVQVQQERARGRRMTAEEQQEFWIAEVLAAQEEIRRLEQEAHDMAVVPPTPALPALQVASADVDDSDFDARLDHITAEGLEDEALIEEDLQPAGSADPEGGAARPGQAVQEPDQPVSKPVLDKPATSNNNAYTPATGEAPPGREPSATVAWDKAVDMALQKNPLVQKYRLLRLAMIWLGYMSGTEKEEGLTLTVRRFVLPIPILGALWWLYWNLQSIPDDAFSGWPGTPALKVTVGTLVCLPFVYGGFRIVTVPKLPAGIAAVVLHATWSVLLVLDRLPWPLDSAK